MPKFNMRVGFGEAKSFKLFVVPYREMLHISALVIFFMCTQKLNFPSVSSFDNLREKRGIHIHRARPS